ncbi:MAG: aspartyl/glutamyl-tRNA amidotransferase subunit A [Coxiella sp. RIFCSPHIGHO2_12_FULL_42_15]|nr:MAG: aspartyl/glutamyl-tRNA amidotransferase subunit A [Coxiella sp. RIFCSPHIGHO2_12_FULL_42_15]
MFTKTIAELSALLHKKEISSVELTQHFLQRITQFDPQLNGFITVTEEYALQQAKRADERLKIGDAAHLTGIPIAQKDIFCTKGVKTSCGSKMLDNFIAPYDATVIQKFNDAGAILLGKTNMDEFAMGSSNENSFYGPVKNPWNLATIPGGSSGGSAAVVAAGLAPGATGTDTGGSIRQPAALCGITGIKPTYGRVSRFGMIAFASSLDQAGPMTRTAEDAAFMLNVMAGHDPKDSTSINREVPDYTATLNNTIKGLRIGLPKEYFDKNLNPEIAACMDAVRKTLEALGAHFKEVSLPHTEYAVPAYYVLAPAECSSNLARYDGIRFGYRCKNPRDLQDLYERSRSEGFGAEVKRRIMIGTYVLSAGYYDAYYLQAQKIRNLIRHDFLHAYQTVDMILAPTSPTVAFNIGDKVKDPVTMYLSDIYTIAVNLAGLPGLSMPAGFSHHLPVGAQLIGNYFDEARILNVAHQYQQNTDWHRRQPNIS